MANEPSDAPEAEQSQVADAPVDKTPEQLRADAIAQGIQDTKKANPGWSGEGPWPPLDQ